MSKLNCSIATQNQSLRRKYLEAIRVCKDVKETHEMHKRSYFGWLSEFKQRVDDMEKARNDTDLPWFNALRQRLKTLNSRMKVAHDMRLRLTEEYENHQVQKRLFLEARMRLNETTSFNQSISSYVPEDCELNDLLSVKIFFSVITF